jgi:hypothetical protein
MLTKKLTKQIFLKIIATFQKILEHFLIIIAMRWASKLDGLWYAEM